MLNVLSDISIAIPSINQVLSWKPYSNSNYGYCFKVNYKTNNRYYGYPDRGSEKWQLKYNKRSSIERCIGRLKEHLNIDSVRSAGIKKAKVVALLSCISLVAGTIAVNQKSNDLKSVA